MRRLTLKGIFGSQTHSKKPKRTYCIDFWKLQIKLLNICNHQGGIVAKKELNKLIISFYENQLSRIEKHESQILIFSQLLVTISIAIITFHSQFEPVIRHILLTLVVVFNFLAIFFIKTSNESRSIHQKRARKVIEKYSNELHEIINQITYDNQNNKGRFCYLIIFHWVLIVSSFAFAIYYLITCIIS